MNERIRELAHEAGLPTYNPDGIPTKLEKFAELIVRECVEIIKPTQHHEAFAQGYMGGVDGLDLLDGKVKEVKKHFGVE